ncbi:hypothetical protein NKJ48_30630 [Mesorhizobium sp. M0114]|uniref:hypothetical protein n=1 Tax=unclassified Mesorhizobium TaxID=325217 RepID=UPI003337CEB1
MDQTRLGRWDEVLRSGGFRMGRFVYLTWNDSRSLPPGAERSRKISAEERNA